MNYVNENKEIPKLKDKIIFSDNVQMGKWWITYKTKQKGNKE